MTGYCGLLGQYLSASLYQQPMTCTASRGPTQPHSPSKQNNGCDVFSTACQTQQKDVQLFVGDVYLSTMPSSHPAITHTTMQAIVDSHCGNRNPPRTPQRHQHAEASRDRGQLVVCQSQGPEQYTEPPHEAHMDPHILTWITTGTRCSQPDSLLTSTSSANSSLPVSCWSRS